MRSESQPTAIGELVEFAIGGGWGNDPQESLEDGEQLVQVIRGTDIPAVQHGHLGQSPFRVETKRKVEKRTLQTGDIVLEISGGSSAKGQTTGRTCLITSEVLENAQAPLIPASFCRLIRLNQEIVCPEFAYYWLQEMYKSGRAGEYENRSTGISNFQFKVFLERETLRLPAMDEQKAIARSLRAIDEKIANNRALAADLEAMARAIFKSWFVDFDPVTAKMEGRAPAGMDADTAALFPNELVESELGLIPKGWEVGTLAIHAELNPESWSARNHPDMIQYADLASTDRGQIVETKAFSWADAPSRARRILRSGDTIVGTIRPGNRAYSYVGFDGLTGSTGFAVLRPRTPSQRSFIYLAATADEAIDRLTNLADGAAYPAVRPDVVMATPVVTPTNPVTEAFAKVTGPLLDWMVASHAESTELAELRDTLLPRLISGKLRLPCAADADPMTEEEGLSV